MTRRTRRLLLIVLVAAAIGYALGAMRIRGGTQAVNREPKP